MSDLPEDVRLSESCRPYVFGCFVDCDVTKVFLAIPVNKSTVQLDDMLSYSVSLLLSSRTPYNLHACKQRLIYTEKHTQLCPTAAGASHALQALPASILTTHA